MLSVRQVMPSWTEGDQARHELLTSPHFYFDSIYVHEKPSKEKENRLQEIFDFLTSIETPHGSSSYYHENSATRRLFSQFAQLLAHPHQRPEQKYFKASVE